ncbi:MAG: hypothetical protein IPL62_06850 [Caulobacteraceae bacterium]|nr:hypothetical protein [Caulobacteraceae bacterium]
MARSVSQQVKNDRGPAGCFAAIAALPALAVLGAILWLLVRSLSYHEKPEDLILSGVFVLFALMFWLVAGWSYSAARAAMTPQRVQAMWLRRFQAEKGSAFRPSRVIDKLSRHGISAITLQDRDVKLSFEQRRNRLAPTFWFFFAPIGALLATQASRNIKRCSTKSRTSRSTTRTTLAKPLGKRSVKAWPTA